MAMRDPRTGKFMKRVKTGLAAKRAGLNEVQSSLSQSKPATLDILASKEANRKSMETNRVSVDVVPTKQNARQSARRSYNMSATITVIGNLVADPELKTTNSGKSVVNFALAYTPRKPDGTDGNTSFYNIVAWEYLADNFSASFKKGDRLIVIGRVSQDKWTDKDSDKLMSRLVITADEIGGTCKFHTVEMSKVQRKLVESAQTEDAESEDIFA